MLPLHYPWACEDSASLQPSTRFAPRASCPWALFPVGFWVWAQPPRWPPGSAVSASSSSFLAEAAVRGSPLRTCDAALDASLAAAHRARGMVWSGWPVKQTLSQGGPRGRPCGCGPALAGSIVHVAFTGGRRWHLCSHRPCSMSWAERSHLPQQPYSGRGLASAGV